MVGEGGGGAGGGGAWGGEEGSTSSPLTVAIISVLDQISVMHTTTEDAMMRKITQSIDSTLKIG